jgi:hypothetical protein
VRDLRTTASEDEAVAPDGKVPDPVPFVPGFEKVIVCEFVTFVMVRVFALVLNSRPSFTLNEIVELPAPGVKRR